MPVPDRLVSVADDYRIHLVPPHAPLTFCAAEPAADREPTGVAAQDYCQTCLTVSRMRDEQNRRMAPRGDVR